MGRKRKRVLIENHETGERGFMYPPRNENETVKQAKMIAETLADVIIRHAKNKKILSITLGKSELARINSEGRKPPGKIIESDKPNLLQIEFEP